MQHTSACQQLSSTSLSARGVLVCQLPSSLMLPVTARASPGFRRHPLRMVAVIPPDSIHNRLALHHAIKQYLLCVGSPDEEPDNDASSSWRQKLWCRRRRLTLLLVQEHICKRAGPKEV